MTISNEVLLLLSGLIGAIISALAVRYTASTKAESENVTATASAISNLTESIQTINQQLDAEREARRRDRDACSANVKDLEKRYTVSMVEFSLQMDTLKKENMAIRKVLREFEIGVPMLIRQISKLTEDEPAWMPSNINDIEFTD